MARTRTLGSPLGVRSGVVALAVAGLVVMPSGPAAAFGGTTLVSVIDGTVSEYGYLPALSGDGSVVVFGATTDAGNHLWARDLSTGQTEFVDVDTDSNPPAPGSQFEGWDVSHDGRYVVFATDATLSPGAGCGGAEALFDYQDPCFQVYRRDLVDNVTELVSIEADGRAAFGGATGPVVSGDGGVVAFVTGLVNQPDGTPEPRVLVRDTATDLTETASVSSDEVPADRGSYEVDLSGDGRTVAFSSTATNLGHNASSGSDIFVRDRVSGTTEPLFGPAFPVIAPGETYQPSVSDDGSIVAFQTQARLVAGDNNSWNVHALDRSTGALVSPNPDALLMDRPQLSGDGRFLLFRGGGGSLPQWTPGRSDVYIHEIATGTTSLAALTTTGAQANLGTDTGFHSISADGRLVAFTTRASNVTPTPIPAGSIDQAYVHDRAAVPGDSNPQDGISDSLQPAGTAEFAFVDESTARPTHGRLVTANGLTGRITDAAATTDGVLVTVDAGAGGPVEFEVCGQTVLVAAGSQVVLTCGSVIVETLSGSAQVVLDGGSIIVSVPAGASAEVEDTPDGATIKSVTGTGVTATVNGTTTPVTGPTTLGTPRWVISEFRAPVDNVPVVNSAKAGRAVPLKWHVADQGGQPVTSLAAADVTIRVETLACDLGAPTDAVEETFVGGSDLKNLGNGNYQLVWKTNSAWAKSCRTMTLEIADRATRQALFRFSK